MAFWRLNASFTEMNINKAIGEAVRRLDYTNSLATENQANAIREFVVGSNVFVILPTGSGKSLCYTALPYVFDILRGETGSLSIVVVVCPLQSIKGVLPTTISHSLHYAIFPRACLQFMATAFGYAPQGSAGCHIVTRPLFLLVRGGVWARD